MEAGQAESSLDRTFGERLRAARKSLRMTQKDFAAAAGVGLGSQIRYEAGSYPALEYLMRVGECGADWYWIVTGQAGPGRQSEDELDLLEAYAAVPEAARPALRQVARVMAGKPPIAIESAPTLPPRHALEVMFETMLAQAEEEPRPEGGLAHALARNLPTALEQARDVDPLPDQDDAAPPEAAAADRPEHRPAARRGSRR